ncbi:MAG: SMP-30/gluconolactonase/LRE family protein [Solirubrobacterales bacterium]
MRAGAPSDKGAWIRFVGHTLGILVGSMLLLLALCATASAAECTDTWTGSSEGSWTTGSNWSAGVPGEADVACIGAGKTVNVSAAGLTLVKGLEGEGGLVLQEGTTFKIIGTAQTWWIGSLQMNYEGNLTGAGSLEVRSAFTWASEATMSGAGKTILGPESVSTIGSANVFFPLVNRTLVNEGTLTQREYSTLAPREGGVFENLGTYDLAGNASLRQIYAEGTGSAFVNRGVFQKTAGSGNANLRTDFENFGTIRAATGGISFEQSVSSFVSADGSNLEGPISFIEKASVTLGTLTAPNASLSLSESQLTIPAGKTAAIGSLGMKYLGNLTGAGTLEVLSSLAWESEGTMSGAGETILGPSAVSTIGSANVNFPLAGRKLVNEGTITQREYATLLAKEGGVFENLGTYKVNGESSRWQIHTEGAGSAFVNKGVFQKTAGTGRAKILATFENLGTIRTLSGTICFEESGSSLVSADGSNLEGPVAVESKAGATLGTMAAPGAELSLKGSQLTIPAGKTASLGNLTMEYQGTVTGEGTLEISKSLSWISGEATMEGSGQTVIGPAATATVTSTSALLIHRTLVNQGTLTLEEQGQIIASEGARIENDATLKPNSVPAYGRWPGITTGLGLVGPELVNNGTVRKTAGSGETRLNINLENKGTIDAESGTLLFNEPSAIVTLKPGSVLKGENRFEGSAVAGENFSAPSGTVSASGATILLEGETTKIANLKLGYGNVISGAGHFEVTEALLWEGAGTFTGIGRLTLGPASKNVLDTGATTSTLSGWFLVNKGTVTQRSSSVLNLNGGAVFENPGTYKLNAEPYGSAQMIVNEGGGTGAIVNEGEFIRTEGKLVVGVVPDFENLGWVKGISSQIEIEHPKKLTAAEKAGCSTTGDPVSCASGNFSESQTDIAIAGRGVGLVLTRSYSAQAAAAATSPGPFGYGWTGSFTDHLTVEEGGAKVTVIRGSGQTTPFTRTSGTTYAAPAWSQAKLSGSPEAGYTFTTTAQAAYRFSGAGRLESVTDRNGNETTLSYDEAGRLKTVTDPAGRTLTFAYNTSGQVEGATDPMGHVVKYAYEGGNLASVTMPGEASPRWQFKYDASHRITQITDGRGGKTTNEYDSAGRVISQTDPAGRTLTFAYEAFHTQITNKATGAVTDEWFTSDNEPFSVTHGYGTPEATTRTFTYNPAGQLTSATDGAGHTTEYGYDEAGNRASEKDPLGHETKWAFNSTHDLVSTTTPRGETTTIARDSHGNVESISRPAPGGETQTTTFKHGSHGELESATNPLGKTWSYGYDSYGDRTSETDPLGDKQTLTYDKDSRVVAIVSPRGNVEGAKTSEYETKIERDAQGRPTKVTDPLGHATEYAYDANGNLASVTDAKGHTTKYTYNADDERTKVEKPNGATLQTGYDGAGYITSQTDGDGKTTTYVRNVLEQPVEVTGPLGHTTHEEFDAAGNLAKVTDPEGRETSYSYDAAGRLTAVNYSEAATPDASFGYDADGNLTSISDGSGESTFAYDQLGRLTRSQDGHGDVVEYAYNLGEQQTGVVYPNGKSVLRSYDAAGRLESATDWLGGKTSFAYDAESNLKGITYPAASGNVDEYAYDRASQMSEAKFKKGSETLASLTFTRDALGQVEEEARHGLPGPEKVSYGYDQNNRLTKAGSSTYEYDAADNLTKAPGTTNTYDAAGELEKGTGAGYAYDKEGERTAATNRTAEVPTYSLSFGGTSSAPGHLSAPQGIALDAEGNAWIADTSHNRIQEFSAKGELVRAFGGGGSGDGQLRAPRGLAIDAKGNLYVADTGNSRVQEFNAKGEFVRKWGTEGTGNGQFRGLQDLAVDPEGHVWTLEGGGKLSANNRVQEFSAEGTYIRQFGAAGSENGQLLSAKGIATDKEGNVWVADSGNNRIEAFKPSGEFIRKFGAEGTGNGQLKGPQDLAFDSEGKLWVADSGNDRLQRFSAEGAYLAQLGAAGPNSGQLSEPQALSIDTKGNLWVADTGNDRVQESTPSEFIRSFGGESSAPGQLASPNALATDKEANVWVADTAHNRIQEFGAKGELIRAFGATGTGNGAFSEPKGVAISPAGNLYVADTGNKRVQEFTSKGEFIRKWGSSGSGNGQFFSLQGIAVDAEGHVWTIDAGLAGSGVRVQEFSSEGTYLAQFGKQGSENGQFKSPQGIATDAAGNVWVADTGNNRIQAFKPSGEFIRKLGTEGAGNGQFKSPAGIAIDSEGNAWVADTGNDRVQKLSGTGTYLSQFGTPGSNAGQFSEPRGVAIDAKGNIWVADTANNRVQEQSGSEFLRQFGGEASSPGHLSAPQGIALDAEGNAWVADTSHNRIQEFNAKGELIRAFGAAGSGDGELRAPRGVAIDAKGNLYVADTANNRVEEFTSKGEFVRKWGSQGEGAGQFFGLQDLAIDPEGHIWTLEGGGKLTADNRIQEFTSEGTFIRQFGSFGSEAGQLSAARGIATDAKGNVWIADTANNRIEEFEPGGKFLRSFGSEGTSNGKFKSPSDLAFDPEGNLWVADAGNSRLQRFSPEGTYLTQFGSTGPNAGQLSEPQALAVDTKGNLWTADTGNDRISAWTWPLNTTTYAYDQAGDLTSIARPKAGENPAISQTLAYDATGLLTAKTSGGVTRHLAWDQSTNLPLLLNDGENSYVYGPGGLPIEQINAKEEPTYLHHDQLGSTRLLTGSGGATSATASFAPYGTLEAKTGTATTPLGFAGQDTDAETGLQYLQARFYEPQTGQFLSRDPAATLTREPYSYGRDNPLNLVDPSGRAAGVVGGCIAGEVADPAGGCVGGAAVGGLVEAGEWAATLGLLSAIAGGDNESSEESTCAPSAQPNFEDPTQPPGPEWEWKGLGPPGSSEGSWYNPETGESLYPDLNHSEPQGPHYDWKSPSKKWYRIYPDGGVEPK